MSASLIVKFVAPWKYRRDQAAQRVTDLRHRDGDTCSRCRRPIRFDLPDGHDLGPKIEEVVSRLAGGSEALDNQCLTHLRCHAKNGCDTEEVKERARIKHEAALFARSRKRRRGKAA